MPADVGVLVVTPGPERRVARSRSTTTVTTVGRHPDSDIFLDDITVSRRHAEIVRGADGFVVRDVGSLNGTYLNRERIEEAPLRQRRRAADRQVQAGVPRRAGERADVVTERRTTCRSARSSRLLQDEFPDVTISKIRFLESQGLLDPERTPSGYRKFYEADIERLRWILRQQRENFLPAQGDQGPARPTAIRRLGARTGRRRAARRDPTADGDAPRRCREPPAGRPSRRAGAARAGPPPPASPGPRRSATGRARPLEADRAGRRPHAGRRRARRRPGPPATSAVDAGRELAQPDRARCSATGSAPAAGRARALRPASTASTLGNDQLLRRRRADRRPAGAPAFIGHGVEARHLRMYKVAAEREAGVFEQLVMPLLKQRNPAARAQATDRLDELAVLGGRPAGRHAAASPARPPQPTDVPEPAPGPLRARSPPTELAAIGRRLGAEHRRRPTPTASCSSACSKGSGALPRRPGPPDHRAGRASTSLAVVPVRRRAPAGSGWSRTSTLDIAAAPCVLVDGHRRHRPHRRPTCSAELRRRERRRRSRSAPWSTSGPPDRAGRRRLRRPRRAGRVRARLRARLRRPLPQPAGLWAPTRGRWPRIPTATCRRCTGRSRPRRPHDLGERSAVGWPDGRDGARRRPGRAAQQHADRAAARGRRRPPRRCRSSSAAPEATAIAFALEEVVDPAADDPRPAARTCSTTSGVSLERVVDHRAARRHLLRRDRAATPATACTRVSSRPSDAHRPGRPHGHADLRRRGRARRGRLPRPTTRTRSARRTRSSSSSASSSTASTPRTSPPDRRRLGRSRRSHVPVA